MLRMRAYLITTSTVFGLITMAHVWRVAAESQALIREPWFVLMTLAAAALCVWALRLLRTSRL